MINKNLIRLPHNIWYNIPDDRPDKKELLSCIDKQIELFGNFQFNEDRSKFRKVITPKEQQVEWDKFINQIDDPDKISYRIEYGKEQDAIFNYDHLEVKIKMDDGKKKKRRAI